LKFIGASRPKNLTRIFTGYWTDGFSKKYVRGTCGSGERNDKI
jgi:hypothetical protein